MKVTLKTAKTATPSAPKTGAAPAKTSKRTKGNPTGKTSAKGAKPTAPVVAKSSLEGKNATYVNCEAIHKAGLEHARKQNLVFREGSKISKGTIIRALHGVSIAECDVPGIALGTAKAVKFIPNAKGTIGDNPKVCPIMVADTGDYVIVQTAKGLVWGKCAKINGSYHPDTNRRVELVG